MIALEPESIKHLAKIILSRFSEEDRDQWKGSEAELLEREILGGRVRITPEEIYWNRGATDLFVSLSKWLKSHTPMGTSKLSGLEITRGLKLKNASSEDYRTISKMMAELGWISQKTSQGMVYVDPRCSELRSSMKVEDLLVKINLNDLTGNPRKDLDMFERAVREHQSKMEQNPSIPKDSALKGAVKKMILSEIVLEGSPDCSFRVMPEPVRSFEIRIDNWAQPRIPRVGDVVILSLKPPVGDLGAEIYKVEGRTLFASAKVYLKKQARAVEDLVKNLSSPST